MCKLNIKCISRKKCITLNINFANFNYKICREIYYPEKSETLKISVKYAMQSLFHWHPTVALTIKVKSLVIKVKSM